MELVTQYCIEKVYCIMVSVKKCSQSFLILIFVCPRELTECAVDIVTPRTSDTVLADAELLVMCQNIASSVVTVSHNSKLFFRLSHSGLVSGILQSFGIVAEDREKVMKALKLWDSLPNRGHGQISAR